MLYLKDKNLRAHSHTHIFCSYSQIKSKQPQITYCDPYQVPTTSIVIKDMELYWSSQLPRKDDCIAFVKDEMYSISEIESIYISIDGESIDIWILIPDRDINLVSKIIEKENNIIDRFINERQTKYIFEFHVIYKCQADESSLVPTNSIKISKPT